VGHSLFPPNNNNYNYQRISSSQKYKLNIIFGFVSSLKFLAVQLRYSHTKTRSLKSSAQLVAALFCGSEVGSTGFSA